MIIAITSAYVTTSTSSAQVMPIMTEIKTRTFKEGKTNKNNIREDTIIEWQNRCYTDNTKALWTKRLKKWITDLHKFLTGNESFEIFLHRIKKRDSDRSIACNIRDVPEHTIFNLHEMREFRNREHNTIERDLYLDTILEIMQGKEEYWDTIHKMIYNILKIEERKIERTK